MLDSVWFARDHLMKPVHQHPPHIRLNDYRESLIDLSTIESITE